MKTYNQRTDDVLNKVEKKRKTRMRIIAGTAVGLSATLVVSANLALFLPFPSTRQDLSVYAGSEYYELMTQIDRLTYTPPAYKNNFEKLADNLIASGMAPELGFDDADDAPTSGENYEEVTLNQTDGVIEGDLFKRSGDYIYYLTHSNSNLFTLNIYSIEGETSQEVAHLTIEPEEGVTFYTFFDTEEVYLSEDCKTVTLLTECYMEGTRHTAIIPIDVSDVDNLRQLPAQYINGSYVSSRLIDGDLLVIDNFFVRSNPDFSNQAEYLPCIGDADGLSPIAMENIVLPENATSARYTVICRYDLDERSFTDQCALFSYADNVYVSAENLFVTRTFYEQQTETGDGDNATFYVSVDRLRTSLACVEYGDGKLDYVDTATVNGTVNDRYSIDEYEGVLRVFSSTYKTYVEDNYTRIANSASLYCIDLDTFEIFASVENFAPDGDTVRSARFDGDKAYVCTAVELTDPVYSFDLSDYDNITYSDSGIIPGYSMSLITFKDDTLLGIGYGGSMLELKLEVYDALTAQSIDSFIAIATFSTEFKSYYINREEGLVGLAIYSNDKYLGNPQNLYMLFRYDGYGLVPVIKESLNDSTDCNKVRATIIDGYLYILNGDQFIVKSV